MGPERCCTRALETYLQRRTKDVTPAVSIDGLIDDILHKYFAKYKSGMTVQQALEAGIVPVNLRCLSACKLVRIGG